MSVIIRLENLPWNASSLDIRRYFYGLDIPDGGVHIVGGERGTAFMVFATDEDARQALMKDNGQIHHETVKLFLSSRTEMQNIITSNRGTSVPIHEVFTNPSYIPQRSIDSSPIPPRRPNQLDSQKRSFCNDEDNDTSNFKIRHYSPSMPDNQSASERLDQDLSMDRRRSDQPPPSVGGRYFKEQRHHVPQGNRSFPFKEKGFGNEREFETLSQKQMLDRYEEPEKEREVFLKPRSFNDVGKRFNNFGQQSEGSGFGRNPSNVFERNRSESDGNWSLSARDDARHLSSKQSFYSIHSATLPDSKSAHNDFHAGHFSGKDDHFSGRLSHGNEQQPYDTRNQSFMDQRGHEQNVGKHNSDWIVHVSNLPKNFHHREVCRLFSNSLIPKNGLKMVNDKKGRQTGECYIRFAFEKGYLEALKCNGTVVSGKPVRVERSNAYEFEAVDDSYIPSDIRSDRTRSRSPLEKEFEEFYGIGITINNFPVKYELNDLIKWLDIPWPKPGEGPQLNYDLSRNRLFKACARFPSYKVMKAVHRCNGKFWRGQRVQVCPIPMKFFYEHGANPKWWTEFVSEEIEEKPIRGAGIVNRPVLGNAGEKKFYCVRIDGLPFSATPQAVKEFFKGLEIANSGIHIVYNRNNKASGIGFVEFVTSTDCRRALDRNKQYMGKRYLIIKPVDKDEFLTEFESLQQETKGFADVPVDHGEDLYDPALEVGNSEADVRLENLHFKVELNDILQFFSGHRPVMESIRLQYRDGQPTGNGMVTFPSVEEAQRAVKELNHRRLLGWPVALSLA